MNIQKQKALAKRVIDELTPHGFNVILAGGAVRDWYRGNPGNDLDFFIAGEPRTDALNLILKQEISPLTDKVYDDSLFEGFQCEIDGQLCQFLFHKCEDPKEHVATAFPIASAEAWYDGENYWYSRAFTIGERYGVHIFETSRINNWKYIDKICEREPHKAVYPGMKTFLRTSFKNRNRLGDLQIQPAPPAEAIDLPRGPLPDWVNDPFAV